MPKETYFYRKIQKVVKWQRIHKTCIESCVYDDMIAQSLYWSFLVLCWSSLQIFGILSLFWVFSCRISSGLFASTHLMNQFLNFFISFSLFISFISVKTLSLQNCNMWCINVQSIFYIFHTSTQIFLVFLFLPFFLCKSSLLYCQISSIAISTFFTYIFLSISVYNL